ncbi:hypothetical protein OG203_42735 [Nocardia sp. NBC_01499]|uniref:hypothetical protein n=1 Tax=Nocardia sp. NBC_01499 TaxID=2903597 RepID=UPI003869184A
MTEPPKTKQHNAVRSLGPRIVTRAYALKLMARTPQYQGNWNYGNAIHDANMVLGRIAVRAGHIDPELLTCN